MKEIKKARMGIIAVLALMLVSITRRLPEARRLSSGITTLALAGIVLLVAAGSASAEFACVADDGLGDAYFFGDTVMKSCTLNGSMSGSGSGLFIGADGITIDGNKFGITGSNDPWSYGILNYDASQFRGYHNVVIKNLDISGFQEGICIQGTSTGANAAKVENNTIYNCIVHDNGANTAELSSGYGIHFYHNVWNSTIDNCKVYDTHVQLQSSCESPGAGIRLYSKSCYNDVTNCKVYKNDLAGIYSKAGSKYNYIDNNDVYENAVVSGNSFPGGIRMQCKNTNWWTVTNNTVWDNYGPGILVGGQNCTVYKNDVTGSKNCAVIADGSRGDGLIIDRSDTAEGGRYNNVTNNTVCDNEGYDILIVDANPPKVGNHGDENMCDKPYNWNDDGATGCTYSCPEKPDLVIIDKYETWIVVGSTYNITYTIENQGGAATSGTTTTGVYIDGVLNTTLTVANGVGILAANGGSETHVISPVTLSGTSDDISLFADEGDGVDECDEDNNWKNNTFSTLRIYVDPPLTNVSPQDQFDINITIDPAGLKIYGVEYYLTYGTDTVRAESQVKGPFLGTTSETIVVVNEIDRTNGIVSYAETRKVSGGVTTEGISSVIQFTAIGPADTCTDLHLYGEIIVKLDGTEVTGIVEDGRVCIILNDAPTAIGCSKHKHNNAQKKFECLAQLCSNSTDINGDDIVYIRWSFGDGEYGTSEGLGDCPCKFHSYTSWIWEPFGDPNGHYESFNASLTVTDNGDPQLESTTYFDVNVYLAGDANADGKVNILDAVLIGLTWDDECKDPTACCELLWADEMADKADLNNDCKINILDAVIVGTMWDHNAYYPV